MSRGCASAWATASLVISWNRTRRTLPLPPLPSWLATCHAMASPSRSGSVARSTRSDAFAARLISARVFAFSLMVTYSGVKPFSTSTPSLRCGRSRRCPTVALTVYPEPKYLPIVFAFVGDSTMTSAPFPPPPPPPLSAAGGLGFRARRLGATATATAASDSAATGAPPSSPGVRPGSAFFRFTASFLAATHQSFVKRRERASLPSRTRLRKPDDLVCNLRRRFPLRLNLRVRTAIELLALFLQESHARHRVLSH